MTSNLLNVFKQKIANLKLIPSGGGCFEISVDGELIYSKLATHEFPDEHNIIEALKKRAK